MQLMFVLRVSSHKLNDAKENRQEIYFLLSFKVHEFHVPDVSAPARAKCTHILIANPSATI